MKAVKGNREYTVTEENMESYIKDGFDIFDNGKKIRSGKGKKVSQEDYDRLKGELEEIKKASGSVPDSDLLPILKEYAGLKGIDTGKASTVKGIMEKIKFSEG